MPFKRLMNQHYYLFVFCNHIMNATLDSATGTNVRNIVCVCVYPCKYLTFLHCVHSLKMQKSKWREKEKRKQEQRRHANWTSVENCTKKSLCTYEISATQNNIIFCASCVFAYGFSFCLYTIFPHACTTPFTVTFASVVFAIPIAIVAKHMLYCLRKCQQTRKKNLYAEQRELHCNYLLTHVIWFLMHQIGNFYAFQWKHHA